MSRSPVLALCVLLALGGFLTSALSGQGSAQEETLEKRVASLEAKVKEMREMAEARDEILRDLDKRARAFDALRAQLPGLMSSLERTVAAADKAGFTYPAPNIKAKELVLKALSDLASGISKAASSKK